MSVEEDDLAPFWTGTADTPGAVRIGLSEAFLETLGSEGRAFHIVGLTMASEGANLKAGDALGVVFLPERAVDLRTPVPMRVVRRNEAALADPRLVAASPALRGWLAEVVLGQVGSSTRRRLEDPTYRDCDC